MHGRVEVKQKVSRQIFKMRCNAVNGKSGDTKGVERERRD
jgi:hypothetical protein